MKACLIFLPIFVFCLFQGTFLSLNLVLLTVLLWTVLRPGKGNFGIVFLAGIFLDLAKGTPLGLSSLLFLLSTGLMILYSHRFDPHHPLFLAFFVFLADLAYSRLVNGVFNWPATLAVSFFALAAGLAWRWLEGGLRQEVIRLKEPL